MTASGRQVSAAHAAAFNGKFASKPQPEQDRALQVLKALMARCEMDGRAISPDNLAEGVREAMERRVKKRDLNLVAYAFSVADRLEQRDAADAAGESHEARKRDALRPLGGPAVTVMGARLPAGEMPEHWRREVDAALRSAGLIGKPADEVRSVMLMLSRGWRDTPTAAIRSVAQGLCQRPANPFQYAIEELQALESVGVVCAAPERDPFLAEIEEFLGHRHDVNQAARDRFIGAVAVLLDSSWSLGEHRIELRPLGTKIVTDTWGAWVQKVIDATMKKDSIPNPYRYLLRKATRLYAHDNGIPFVEDKDEHHAYS